MNCAGLRVDFKKLQGLFSKNYMADRYLRSMAIGSGSDGPDLIWNLDCPFTIGRPGPELESGSPVYDRMLRTRSGSFRDHGVSGCAHRDKWRLRTSTQVGSSVRAHGCASSLWTRGGTGPAILWGADPEVIVPNCQPRAFVPSCLES